MPTLQQRLADSADRGRVRQAMQALTEFLRDDLDDLAMKKLWRSIFSPCGWPTCRRSTADWPSVLSRRPSTASGRTMQYDGGRSAFVRRSRPSGRASTSTASTSTTPFLARHFVRESLAWCRAKDWAPASVDAFAAAIDAGWFAAPKCPDGPRLHYGDVLLEALVEFEVPHLQHTASAGRW